MIVLFLLCLAAVHAQPQFPFKMVFTDDNAVRITMSAPSATSWIAIGFNKDGQMVNSDIIVCKQGTIPACTDRWASNLVEPTIDPIQNIKFVESVANGVWTVDITRLMNTGDAADYIIRNGTQKLIWSIGSGATGNYHSIRGAFSYDPATGKSFNIERSNVDYMYWIAGAIFALAIIAGTAVHIINVTSLKRSIGSAVPHDLPGTDSLTEMSIGEVLFVLMYLGALAIAMIGISMSFTSADRAPAGRVWGMANRILIGTVLFPVTRMSPFTALLGISTERMVKYHRWLGRLLFVSMTIHFGIMANEYGGSYITSWPSRGNSDLGELKPGRTSQPPLPGLLSWICVAVMTILAIEPIRRRMWKLFILPHFIFFIPSLVFACLHDKTTLVLVIISGAGYILDAVRRVIRFSKTYESEIQPIEGVGCKITVTCKGFTWGPGEYVWLKLGDEFHPFSIANAPSASAPNTFKLMIKNMGPGKFTDTLSKMSTVAPRFEGPHGTLSVPLEKYKAVCIVAGGIGVTAMASILDFIVTGAFPNIEAVTFIWVVREEVLVAELAPLLTAAAACTTAKIKTYVHLSKALTAPAAVHGIETLSGRPKFAEYLADLITSSNQPRIGMYVCGPDPMVVSAINDSRTAAVPVDVHMERFYL